MSAPCSKKVFIQIESEAEQQEHIKNQRKTLKLIQGTSIDKENLAGRPTLDKFARLKATTEANLGSNDYAKRKKIELRIAQTQTSPGKKDEKLVTEKDLTSSDNPGEHYWERLAEKRRDALEQTLTENQHLVERIEGLEAELNTSRQQLEEAQNLVAILTEMLNENENEIEGDEKGSTDGNESSVDTNQEAAGVDN